MNNPISRGSTDQEIYEWLVDDFERRLLGYNLDFSGRNKFLEEQIQGFKEEGKESLAIKLTLAKEGGNIDKKIFSAGDEGIAYICARSLVRKGQEFFLGAYKEGSPRFFNERLFVYEGEYGINPYLGDHAKDIPLAHLSEKDIVRSYLENVASLTNWPIVGVNAAILTNWPIVGVKAAIELPKIIAFIGPDAADKYTNNVLKLCKDYFVKISID